MMKSLYVEGATPLHRMTARSKLVMLLVASVVLFFVTSPLVLLPVFLLCAATYFTLGLPLREAFGRVGWVLFAILVLALATLYFDGARQAAAMSLRIGAVVFLAAAITATTTISAFMDEITVLLQPLERMGLVRAADVGLALALVIRFVPEILERYGHIREAHRARGLPMRPLTLFAPLIILTLKEADTIAMAIDARGFRRQE